MDDTGTEFINKLIQLKLEGVKLRDNKHIHSVWTEEEDHILEQLDNLINFAKSTSASIAEDEFNDECPLARFPTFLSYLSSRSSENNLELMRCMNMSTAKTKFNRTTSKIDKCKVCGWSAHIDGSRMVCDNPACGNSEEIKTKASKLKVDSMKHTRNKIEMLIGLKDPPKKIIELFPLAKVWLTDLRYLYDWLKYQETFKIMKNRMTFDKWIATFRSVYEPRKIDGHLSRQWQMKIPETAEYAWTFNEYKLLIAEFHAMITECDRLAMPQYTLNNLPGDEDKIVEIFQAYYEAEGDLPDPGKDFVYEDVNYRVGNYINDLALTHEESEIKHRLEEIFKKEIKIPGLMTNFKELSVKKIERHALTEGCSYIVHRAFHVPYVMIPSDDIEKMLDIIINFDAFVKELSKNNNNDNKKKNSKLYVCKLRCILTLPYFYKYASISDYMTTKSTNTEAQITSKWDLFKSKAGKALIDQYYDEREDDKNDKDMKNGRDGRNDKEKEIQGGIQGEMNENVIMMNQETEDKSIIGRSERKIFEGMI